MKGERRLRLVPPAAVDAEEAPATEVELREAEELREAIERGVDPLAAALAAAIRPPSIDDDDSDALLARALGDADAPPTKAERALAERLAAELDAAATAPTRRGPSSQEAELAGALKAAWAPRSIDDQTNEALIERATRRSERARPKRARVIAITMVSLASAAAMAAGVALLVGRTLSGGGAAMESAATAPSSPMSAAQASFIRARSAAELFDAATPFPRSGGESARIDRIASARASDLRANRFVAWGVQ